MQPSRSRIAYWLLRKVAGYWRRHGTAQTVRRMLQRLRWLPAPEEGWGATAGETDPYARRVSAWPESTPVRLHLLDGNSDVAAALNEPGDVLVVTVDAALDAVRRCVARAALNGVPVVALVGERERDTGDARVRQFVAWADTCIDSTERDRLAERIAAWLPSYFSRATPRVSVIVAGEGGLSDGPVEYWLDQSYEGIIEYFVPGDTAYRHRDLITHALARRPNIEIHALEDGHGTNVTELRNRAFSQSRGDLVIFTGPDCLLPRDFVLRHVQAHAFGDCEIAIGAIASAERTEDAAAAVAMLQDRGADVPIEDWRDPQNPASFVNCHASNLSVRRGALGAAPYDPECASGAPRADVPMWEDVEMGFRLYQAAARIKPVAGAACVRVGASLSIADATGTLGLPAPFLRKHAEFPAVAARWLAARQVRASRGLRVLTYRWHVPHQYELYRLGHEFTLVTDLGSQITRGWDFAQRPLPANVRFARWRDVEPDGFDLAILHFDENVVTPENTEGLFGPEWGATFRWFVEHVHLPKIAVCHGTPQIRARPGPAGKDAGEVNEPAREALVNYVGEMPVVCNSHQARDEWRFRRSHVIWHGFDPAEFPPADPRERILSPVDLRPVTRPHYQGQPLYREVTAGFPAGLLPEVVFVPEPSPVYRGNAYARAKFRNYVDAIRSGRAYFNPTLRSPMPRARGEAMLCGVPTVSARNHDVDLFIRNGVNGFFAGDADELREQLLYLARNRDAARRIGLEGRRTALEIFNLDRFLAQWRELFRAVI